MLARIFALFACAVVTSSGFAQLTVEIPPREPPPCELPFVVEEMLLHPDASSTLVSMHTGSPTEAFVEYRLLGEKAWTATERRRAETDEPLRFLLSGLWPGEEYEYRVRCRAAAPALPYPYRVANRAPFGVRPIHRFRHLGGHELRFAFMTDSHIYKAWSIDTLYGTNERTRHFGTTLENIAHFGAQLVVLGGDEVMTHCLYCPRADVDGESAGEGTVSSTREAELRYRQTLRLLAPLTATTPVFLTLGNHDGEAGFEDDGGHCGHWSGTASRSRRARLELLGNPSDRYSGARHGQYHAFRAGDALFIILDVMSATEDLPREPGDWTLGQAQLDWLHDTLQHAEAPWVFVFMHHLAGGFDLTGPCYAYGRGGLRATTDSQIGSPFLGEQELLHTWFEEFGVQAVFYGHDHVFAAGRKPGEHQVLYVAGGKPNGPVQPGWLHRKVFRAQYDYDGDGEPDFIARPGYVAVTIEGSSASVRYVLSDENDPLANGTTLYETHVNVGPRARHRSRVARAMQSPRAAAARGYR